MNLTRLYAYEVPPQKGKTSPTNPEGGKIAGSSSLRQTLDDMIKKIRLEDQAPIAFQVDDPRSGQRRNDVREALLTFAFGAGSHVSESASRLALRLSLSMDERSDPFLLILSVFKELSTAKVVLFAFPKDEGLKFSMSSNGAIVEVVKDIFNVSSNLKKAAMFVGEHSDDSFWDGRMVDLQSGRTDLWVERFLACRLAVSGVYGTSLLCDHVTIAYRQASSNIVREELFSAIIAVRTAPIKRMSFMRFANDYLGQDARSEFLAIVPSDNHNISFDFDRDTFERRVGIRVFRMADDVIVAAPFPTIDNSIVIDKNQLKYSGTIKSDYLKGAKRV